MEEGKSDGRFPACRCRSHLWMVPIRDFFRVKIEAIRSQRATRNPFQQSEHARRGCIRVRVVFSDTPDHGRRAFTKLVELIGV